MKTNNFLLDVFSNSPFFCLLFLCFFGRLVIYLNLQEKIDLHFLHIKNDILFLAPTEAVYGRAVQKTAHTTVRQKFCRKRPSPSRESSIRKAGLKGKYSKEQISKWISR